MRFRIRRTCPHIRVCKGFPERIELCITIWRTCSLYILLYEQGGLTRG